MTRSWFNLGEDNKRPVDIEYNKQLEKYYDNIRNTSIEQSKYIPPDFDEIKENNEYWKLHPETMNLSGSISMDMRDANLIDPLNPPKRITKYSSSSSTIKKSRIQIPKRIRNFVIEKYNNICVYCEADTIEHLHHVDGDPSNNEIDNLIGLCYKCHKLQHKKIERIIPSKQIEYVSFERVYPTSIYRDIEKQQ